MYRQALINLLQINTYARSKDLKTFEENEALYDKIRNCSSLLISKTQTLRKTKGKAQNLS